MGLKATPAEGTHDLPIGGGEAAEWRGRLREAWRWGEEGLPRVRVDFENAKANAARASTRAAAPATARSEQWLDEVMRRGAAAAHKAVGQAAAAQRLGADG